MALTILKKKDSADDVDVLICEEKECSDHLAYTVPLGTGRARQAVVVPAAQLVGEGLVPDRLAAIYENALEKAEEICGELYGRGAKNGNGKKREPSRSELIDRALVMEMGRWVEDEDEEQFLVTLSLLRGNGNDFSEGASLTAALAAWKHWESHSFYSRKISVQIMIDDESELLQKWEHLIAWMAAKDGRERNFDESDPYKSIVLPTGHIWINRHSDVTEFGCLFCIVPFSREGIAQHLAENIRNQKTESFQEKLLALMDQSGEKDADIYKRAGVDRKLFSKIRSNRDYHPRKATAIAFAIALHLDWDDAQDLIARAGYLFTHASRADIIVEYYIQHRKYDMLEINDALEAFGEVPLGK